jgi:hypothetical protein
MATAMSTLPMWWSRGHHESKPSVNTRKACSIGAATSISKRTDVASVAAGSPTSVIPE